MDTKKLRQKILDLAIHGKLVPQDPNDEPASVLLERIRAEKEQLIKEGKIKAPKKSNSAGDTSHYPKEGPWELPEGWVWTTLDKVCSIRGGKRIPKGKTFAKERTAHVYIRVTDMKNMTVDTCGLKYIDDEVFDEINSYIIEKDDLYLTIAGTIGKVGTIPEELHGMNLTENAARLTDIVCDKLYLMYALQTDVAQTHFSLRFHQVAQPKLSIETASSTPIALPPLPEQKRIVSVIETLLTCIHTIEEEQQELETNTEKTKSRILDLAIHGKLVPQDPTEEPAIELLMRTNSDFTPSDNLHYDEPWPIGWTVTPLHGICNAINGLWKGTKSPLINVGVIRNANFTKDFTLDYSKIEFIDVEQKSFEKRNLEDGDIIVEKSGGSDNYPVGRSILYRGENGKYSFSNFTMSLRITKKDCIIPEYLYYVLQYRYRRGDMRQLQTQTTGLHNLLIDKFMSLSIPVPPVAEQKRIVQAVKSLFGLVNGIRDLASDGKQGLNLV